MTFELQWLPSQQIWGGNIAIVLYSNIFEYTSAISYHIHILFAPSTAYYIHMYLNIFIFFFISYLWQALDNRAKVELGIYRDRH
jgi:hypothetical protein